VEQKKCQHLTGRQIRSSSQVRIAAQFSAVEKFIAATAPDTGCIHDFFALLTLPSQLEWQFDISNEEQ
jgi:hypothetical protein